MAHVNRAGVFRVPLLHTRATTVHEGKQMNEPEKNAPEAVHAPRVAVVTGGESGIGKACSIAFGAHGYDVAVCYHTDRDGAMEVCSMVERSGVKAIAIKLDVRFEKQVETAFNKVVKRLGTPGVLVNSAGLNMHGIPVSEMELKSWQQLIDTDLTGAFLASRRMVRELEKAKRPGRIINISSIHATVVRAGGAAYDAAKAGMRALTATMALETAAKGITVNAIAPGMILTPMNEHAMKDAAYLENIAGNIPAGRAGKAQEVARLAVYLASTDASYITGTTVTIDGGLSLLLGQGA